jgi:hypothetical protein
MEHKKPIPYNTGKVLIGSNYRPPASSYTSHEDEFWQDVLLGEYQARRLQRVQFICYVVALTGLLFVAFHW